MNHQDWLAGKLKDDAFAAQYLTQAAQDLEPAVFTTALRHVIDARGGLAKVADAGKLSSQSLYKAFPLIEIECVALPLNPLSNDENQK